jgi:magnesium chelatase family protein
VESGEIMVARANAHIRYPARFMLVAAANPCKCGYLPDPDRACSKVPLCGQDYLGRISGPLMDRFDLRFEVPPVQFTDLDLPPSGDTSKVVAQRVAAARDIQLARLDGTGLRTNSELEGQLLQDIATPDAQGKDMLSRAAEKLGLSARGYHRVMKVARTIADLDHSEAVRRPHVAEALSYRVVSGTPN